MSCSKTRAFPGAAAAYAFSAGARNAGPGPAIRAPLGCIAQRRSRGRSHSRCWACRSARHCTARSWAAPPCSATPACWRHSVRPPGCCQGGCPQAGGGAALCALPQRAGRRELACLPRSPLTRPPPLWLWGQRAPTLGALQAAPPAHVKRGGCWEDLSPFLPPRQAPGAAALRWAAQRLGRTAASAGSAGGQARAMPRCAAATAQLAAEVHYAQPSHSVQHSVHSVQALPVAMHTTPPARSSRPRAARLPAGFHVPCRWCSSTPSTPLSSRITCTAWCSWQVWGVMWVGKGWREGQGRSFLLFEVGGWRGHAPETY